MKNFIYTNKIILLFILLNIFVFFYYGFHELFYKNSTENYVVNFYKNDIIINQSNNFKKSFKIVMGHEGVYSNDKFDAGKETFYGISRVYYPDWNGWKIVDKLKTKGYFSKKSTKNINISNEVGLLDEVRDFYYQVYWLGMKCDKMTNKLAFELFEQSINLGHERTIIHLQKVLNSLNHNNILGENVKTTGIFGNITEKMTIKALSNGLEDALVNGLNALQGVHYINVTKTNENKKRYVNGWLLKRVSFNS